MSAKPRLTFRGLAPGECPSVVIEIPLNGENAELAAYVEKCLGQFFGQTGGAAGLTQAKEPPDGDHH